MLSEDPSQRPVKAANAAKLERMIVNMSQFNGVMDEAVAELRSSIRITKAGGRYAAPKSCPELNAVEYIAVLQQAVDDQRSDVIDLQNLQRVLTTGAKTQMDPQEIAERINRQYPAAAGLLRDFMLEGGLWERAAPESKGILFEKLQLALEKRAEYNAIMSNLTYPQPMYDMAGAGADPVVISTRMNPRSPRAPAELIGQLSM
jgi:hypothetical protein